MATGNHSDKPPQAEPPPIAIATPPRQLPLIRPAFAATGTGAASGVSRPPAAPSQTRRRTAAVSACEACRKRKSKCSAERPSCAVCLQRGTTCDYDTSSVNESHNQALKRKYADVVENRTACEAVIACLRDRPRIEALAILERIRSGADPLTVLHGIEQGDLLLQISIVPQNHQRYQFPFCQQMPSYLMSGDNPYLHSSIFEFTESEKSAATTTPLPSNPNYGPIYLQPFHEAEVVDPWLDKVRPSQWTAVCENDDWMRQLLDAYFLLDYQCLPLFHKDSFLQDMAAQRDRFCSSLLVNAVLAYSWLCHKKAVDRDSFENPWSIGYQFFAEGKRLWELEMAEMTEKQLEITTIQAGQLLSMTYCILGLDKVGWTYTARVVAMAQDMRLLDPTYKVSSEKQRRVRELTAWALFTRCSLQSYAWHTCPLIEKPPEFILPNPTEDSSWYSEIWVRYPTASGILTTDFGYLFKARAELVMIISEIANHCFRTSLATKLSLTQIKECYARLQSWHENLPPCLSAENIALPAHLMLHAQYQNVLINLHEEYTSISSMEDAGSPRFIAIKASHHFETILRIYYFRHGCESLNLYLCQALILLGFMSIKRIADLDPTEDIETSTSDLYSLRSTLFLAVKATYSQAHHIAKFSTRILVDSMRPEEREILSRVAELQASVADLKQLQIRNVQSFWPLAVVGITEDVSSQRLSDLCKGYELAHGHQPHSGGTAGPSMSSRDSSASLGTHRTE